MEALKQLHKIEISFEADSPQQAKIIEQGLKNIAGNVTSENINVLGKSALKKDVNKKIQKWKFAL